MLDEVCSRCHNEKKPNAGLNFAAFLDPASIASKRDTWELIVDKLKAGDMPPADEEPLSAGERADDGRRTSSRRSRAPIAT